MASINGAGTRTRTRRRLADLFLNVLFVVWVLHVLITGHLVPQQLLNLLRHEAPVSVVVEPVESPANPHDVPGMILDET